MEVIYRRCAGLDVHEKNVFVCARIMRGKEVEIIEATFSTFTQDLDRMSGKIKLLEARIGERMQPYRELIDRLCQMPGIDRMTAWTVISEIGVDMSRFPTSGNLASWCGLCPGNAASAGKRHSGRTTKGNRYIRRVLVQAAWAAARISRKRNFFTAFFNRISNRAGMKKAAVAVAHRMLAIIYAMIRDGSFYRENGADYFDRLHPERTRNRLLKRLANIGFPVSLPSSFNPQTS